MTPTGVVDALIARTDLTPADKAEIAAWDWTSIRLVEDTARRRVWARPRCENCEQPLTAGQVNTHKLCEEKT